MPLNSSQVDDFCEDLQVNEKCFISHHHLQGALHHLLELSYSGSVRRAVRAASRSYFVKEQVL